MIKEQIKQGDVYYVNIKERKGSVQCGIRPVLITQNNFLNKSSQTYTAVAITSKLKRPRASYHVVLPPTMGLSKKSMVLAEQQFTLDRGELLSYRCHVDNDTMKKVRRAVKETTKSGDSHCYHHRKKTKKITMMS